MITRDHPEWPGFRRYLEAKIEEMKNDLTQAISHEASVEFRGRIAALRWVIEDVEPNTPNGVQPNYSGPRR